MIFDDIDFDEYARQYAERARVARIVGPPPFPDPLPALPRVAYPKKLEAEPIGWDALNPHLLHGTLDDLVRDVQEKLAAEAARIRRLLPPALPGYTWRGEIAHDVDYRFDDFTSTDTIRLRYRMVRIDGEV